MKRFFFILFIFLIWYMAAMYRIPSLMALSVAQLFLLLLLFLMTRYFRNNFQAGFCRKRETVRKKDRIPMQIWTENRSFLPLNTDSRVEMKRDLPNRRGREQKKNVLA